MTSSKLSEDLELIKFFDWVSWHKKLDPRLDAIIHVANERRTSFAQGKILKQKGVKSGVFDVIGFIPSHGYHGIVVELKIKPNKLSKNQEEFGKLLHGLGWCVRIAWSGDELIQIVKDYLK